MSSSLDPDAVEIIPRHHNEYGPSDTSDSASDVAGSDAQEADTSTGTGERSSVESTAPTETENDLAPDISPDKVVHSPDGESDGGDDTYEDEELNVRDGTSIEDAK